MQVKLNVELCRPQVTEPDSPNSGVVFNPERGCHCHPPKLQAEMLEAYADPRIQLMEETIVMHLSVVMVSD